MAKPQQSQSWPYKPIYPPHQQYNLPYRHPSLCQETCFRSNGSSAPPMAYHRHHQQLHRSHPMPQLPYPPPPPSGMPYGGQDNPYVRRKPSQIPPYISAEHYLPQQSGSSHAQPQQIIHRPIPQNRYDYSDFYRLNQQPHHPTAFHHMPPSHHHTPYQPARQPPAPPLPQSNLALVNQTNAPSELTSPAPSSQYSTTNPSFNTQQDSSLNNIDVRQFLSTWQDMDEEVSETPPQPTYNKSLYLQPLDCTKRPDLYNVQNNSYYEKPQRSTSQDQPYQQGYATNPLEALSNAVESHPVLNNNINMETQQHVDRALNYMPRERRIEKICNPSLAYNQYSMDDQFMESDGYQLLKQNTEKSQYHLTASLESSDLFDDINRKKEEKQKNVVHPMRYDDASFIRYASKKPDLPLVSVRPHMQFIVDDELGSEGTGDHFTENDVSKTKMLESCLYSNEMNHPPTPTKEPSPLRCSSPFILPCVTDDKTPTIDTVATSLPLLNFDAEDITVNDGHEVNNVNDITGQHEDLKNDQPEETPIVDAVSEETRSFDNAEYCCIHFGLPRSNSEDTSDKSSVTRKEKLFVFKVKRLLLRIKKNLSSEKNLLNVWKVKNGLPLLGKKSQPRSKISAAHLCKRLEEVNRFLLLKKRYAKRKRLKPIQTTYSFSNDTEEVKPDKVPSETISQRDSIVDFDQSTIDIQLIDAEEVELSENESKEVANLQEENDMKNNQEKESLKCSLPWHKIFKNQPKLSGCKESLVLGPAKVKFSSPQTQTNTVQWKIVEPQRTSNLPSSIVSVKRLIVKHNIFEERVPKMVIKKTEGKEYKSFIKNNEIVTESIGDIPSDNQPIKDSSEKEDEPQEPIKTVHHCLLCQESFSQLEEFDSHEKSDQHRRFDLIQRNALYKVKSFMDESELPQAEPLSESEMKFLYWRPDYPGFKHVYHNAPF